MPKKWSSRFPHPPEESIPLLVNSQLLGNFVFVCVFLISNLNLLLCNFLFLLLFLRSRSPIPILCDSFSKSQRQVTYLFWSLIFSQLNIHSSFSHITAIEHKGIWLNWLFKWSGEKRRIKCYMRSSADILDTMEMQLQVRFLPLPKEFII